LSSQPSTAWEAVRLPNEVEVPYSKYQVVGS
jgi:hypothetical protein